MKTLTLPLTPPEYNALQVALDHFVEFTEDIAAIDKDDPNADEKLAAVKTLRLKVKEAGKQKIWVGPREPDYFLRHDKHILRACHGQTALDKRRLRGWGVDDDTERSIRKHFTSEGHPMRVGWMVMET